MVLHVFMCYARSLAMKTNVTLKLDRDLLRKVRVLAAERDTSMSALMSEQLEKAVREHDGYEQAKRRALARMKQASNLGYTPPASRDEFYER
jgi:predicted transcriptional regulator